MFEHRKFDLPAMPTACAAIRSSSRATAHILPRFQPDSPLVETARMDQDTGRNFDILPRRESYAN
jgi:hypothetical protein